MSNDPNSHVTGLIETSLAGGLNDQERIAFQDHVRDCASCAAALSAAQEFDGSIASLLSDARPDPGLEDRMVGAIRHSARSRSTRPTHPMVRRAAIGIAATILLGGFGYLASNAIEDGTFPLPSLVPRAYSVGSGQALSAISRDDRTAHSTFYEGVRQAVMGRRESASHGQSSFTTEIEQHDQSSRPIAEGPIREPTLELDKKLPQVSVPDGGTLLLGGQVLGGQVVPQESTYFRPGSQPQQFNAKPSEQDLHRLQAIEGIKHVEKGADALADDIHKDFEHGKVTLRRATASAGMLDASVDLSDETKSPQGQKRGTGGQQSSPADSAAGRKVIRSGEMTFEVDSFDSTIMTITKIVGEEGGFVSTTDSDKLANGKVKGTIVLRVPPGNLDTLVLKLRGIGDLKSQKINAQDITKQYTDLQSELRAARAMEDRLLDIIKTGKGEVKDLLEAEKQLGVWREKIEQVEGEMRYDDNLVSLSTLSITLIEKDIKNAAYVSETEQVTMALETANVESAYDKAKEAIAAAKGRIVQSDLQQHDAGQFSGTIMAALPPDAADGVIARLRQLDGRVANFQRQRAQKSQEGTGAPLNASLAHREDVTLSLTMYNLANVEPRRSVSLLLAAPSVDESYRKVLDAIASAGGRVVTASVNRGKPEQSTATMKFDIASDKADVLLAAVRAAGEVVHSETSDNPDTQNVTEAKRGFVLTIEALAAAAARETQQLKIASASVPDGFNDLLNVVVSKGGRVISSQLDQQDRESITGVLEFEISRDASAAIDAAVNKAGEIIGRNISRSQDTQNTVDSKIQFHIDLLEANSPAVVGEHKSVWGSIRHGLEVSATGLLESLTMIVIGFCFVAPWALIIWIVWRILRKRSKGVTAPVQP